MTSQDTSCKRKDTSPAKQDKCKRLKVECIDSKDDTPQALQTESKLPSKKRYAILMGFCGDKYKGMMINPGVRTIEEELLKAFHRSSLIKSCNATDIKKLSFQRASRTDKGVSAARQIVSCNLHVDDVERSVELLNSQLPSDIIVYDIIRTTKSYDCHKYATSRVYQYLCPTYVFAKTYAETYIGYRLPQDVLEQVRTTLTFFVGTKNFFNYTSGKKMNDPSCSRYLRSIECSDPFVMGNTEWVRITLHGDSFMYHMIRKIIGMTIATTRDVTPAQYLQKSFESERCDVPLAPGLGLILEEVKQQRYNNKFASDNTRKPLVWDAYEETVRQFKADQIEKVIYEEEQKRRVVLQWVETLKMHTFYTGDVLPESLFTKPEVKSTVEGVPCSTVPMGNG